MGRKRREYLLWGLVGALSFLVLAQGHRLLFGNTLAFRWLLVVAVVVGAVAAVGSVLLERWLAGKRRV